jgi:hypothetical protein
MQKLKLRHDPLKVFQEEESAYSIWVRRHILDDFTTKDAKLQKALVADLLKKQSADGSFNQGVADTVDALFQLVLLGGPRTAGRKAVDWLMEVLWETTSGLYKCSLFNRMTAKDINDFKHRRDLIFNYGCSAFVNTGAVIHFAGYFGASDSAAVDEAIHCLDRVAKSRRGLFCSPYCSDNILRGFLKHPFTKDGTTAKKCVQAMEELLLDEGGWQNCHYPYHTFNVISQSHCRSAKRQVEKTLPRMMHSQNADGTWGKDEYKHIATFMIVDALNEQGLLHDLIPEG